MNDARTQLLREPPVFSGARSRSSRRLVQSVPRQYLGKEPIGIHRTIAEVVRIR